MKTTLQHLLPAPQAHAACRRPGGGAATTRPSTRCGAPDLGSQSPTPARRAPTTGVGLVQILPVFAVSSRAAVVIELTTRQVALLHGRLVTTCHTFRGFEEQDVIYTEGAGHQPQDRVIAQRRAAPVAGASRAAPRSGGGVCRGRLAARARGPQSSCPAASD